MISSQGEGQPEEEVVLQEVHGGQELARLEWLQGLAAHRGLLPDRLGRHRRQALLVEGRDAKGRLRQI